MAGRKDLGEIRRKLLERYEKIAEEVRNYTLPDLVRDKIEKTIWGFLTELGVDYPVDFDRPPPDAYVPARQGTVFLEPLGTVDGSSPPKPLDEACFTWRARDGGFLVIDHLDFIMEDPIAEEFFTITYEFDGQKNEASFQNVKSVSEPGHWKFNRMVLVDGEVMKVCVKNTNSFAGGHFSFESRLWSL